MELDTTRRTFLDAVMEPLGEDASGRECLAEALAISAALPPVVKGDAVEPATCRMRATGDRFRFQRFLRRAAIFFLVLPAAWIAVLGTPALHSIERIYLANRVSDAMGSMCCSEGVPDLPRIGKDDLEGPEPSEIAGMTEQVSPASIRRSCQSRSRRQMEKGLGRIPAEPGALLCIRPRLL